jgi:hypothetical protein
MADPADGPGNETTSRSMSLEQQSAAAVMMIRPVRFTDNPQTRSSNAFQASEHGLDGGSAQARALAEFEALAQALETSGVKVHVFDDTPEPHTPDSIFPNNWVSFHADGTVVLYPMMAPNRRLERRMDVLEALSMRKHLRIARIVDLTHFESEGKYLEGTGSLVLDRTRRIAFACLSPRTHLEVVGDFAQQLDYEVVAFEAHDERGMAIYHTNVLMCVGTRFAVVCGECIRAESRAGVFEALRAGGRTLVELSLAQLKSFAGNMLELRTRQGGTLIAMSSRAIESLSDAQRAALEASVDRIVAVPIPTIETLGGGSVRCMLAEVHLPEKSAT